MVIKMRKIILPVIFTILLTLFFLLVFVIDVRSELTAALSFTVQREVQEKISAWTEDGKHYYVFFPSYAGLNDAAIHLNTTAELFLDGQPFADDFDLSRLELETPY